MTIPDTKDLEREAAVNPMIALGRPGQPEGANQFMVNR